MYSQYFIDGEVKPEFQKEFISLFNGWLGEENLHRLDSVTDQEWERFNDLLKKITRQYEVFTVNCEEESCDKLEDVQALLSTHAEQKEKEDAQFVRIIIPELDCVLTEDWDYTFILWVRDDKALKLIKPLVAQSKLYSFH